MGNGEICKRELWFEKPLVIFEGLKKLACKCFMSSFWKHAGKQFDELSNQLGIQIKNIICIPLIYELRSERYLSTEYSQNTPRFYTFTICP